MCFKQPQRSSPPPPQDLRGADAFPLPRDLTPDLLPPSRSRMELESPRLQDCVLGAKALQDLETWPRKVFLQR